MSEPQEETARRVPSTRLRRVLARLFGVFPILEASLKLRTLPAAVRYSLLELREVRRLRRELDGPVVAKLVTIIPTMRRPELSTTAVLSALAQTEPDHRIVVVDDGGGQLPVVDDPRVTLVSLSRNLGTAGVVRNIGIRLSRSDYIAFLDDDNRWRPDHLEISMAAHNEGAELSYTAIRRAWPDGRLLDELSVPFDRRALRSRAVVDTSAIVVRRGRRVRFSRVARQRMTVPGEDWEFVYRLSRRLDTRHVPVTTVDYLVHSGSYFSDWSAITSDDPAVPVMNEPSPRPTPGGEP